MTAPALQQPRSSAPKGQTPSRRFASLPGVRLYYEEYGRTGPAVVLLHGLASSGRIWRPVAQRLAGAHRVLAPDMRGHGRSDRPDTGYDFANVASDVESFIMRSRAERPLLAGHSWGAHVALEVAARRPEALSGLVLVDGGLDAFDGMSWDQVERELAPPDFGDLTMEGLVAEVRANHWRAFWGPDAEATLRSLFDVDRRGRVRPRLARRNHMRILRAVWEQRLNALYEQVHAPVLLAPATREAGDGLLTKQEQVARAAAALPDARVRWFDYTYHDVPLQRPNQLAETIASFVAQLT